MELLLLFAFAALFAISYGYAQPKLIGRFPTFATSYWKVTFINAVLVLALLVAVSFVFAKAGVKEGAAA